MPRKNRHAYHGKQPTRPANPRIHRPSHRTRPRPRPGSQLRRHQFPHSVSAHLAPFPLRDRQRRRRRPHRPRPGSRLLRFRRRRRSRAVHGHHQGRPISGLSFEPRNRPSHRPPPFLRRHAHGKLESPAHHSHDQHQPAARLLERRRPNRGYGRRHSHGDESFLVHR